MSYRIQKPIPQPDELTEPFWVAIDRGQFLIQRCVVCKRFHHPPVGVCPDCLSDRLSFEPVSGRAVVVSYTFVWAARQPSFRENTPYTVAIVKLEEQENLLMFSNLPGVEMAGVRVGLRVQLTFETIVDGRSIPQFAVRSGRASQVVL